MGRTLSSLWFVLRPLLVLALGAWAALALDARIGDEPGRGGTARGSLAAPPPSRLDPESGEILASDAPGEPRAEDGVELEATRGMAIQDGVLYVADADVVRTFDRASGEPRGAIPVPGAAALEGVGVGADGSIHVSGTPSGEPSEVAIWRLTGGGFELVARGPASEVPSLSALLGREERAGGASGD